MGNDLITRSESLFLQSGEITVPAIIADAGESASERFLEFFAATIRNKNTRTVYAHAVGRFFRWCELKGFGLADIRPLVIATYIEQLQGTHSAPTVKLHLAAIRTLFDWLVRSQVVPVNPAASIRGPRYVVKKGKTPVLSAEDARKLLDSIPVVARDRETGAEMPDLLGLRDRALIAVMAYSFARVSATANMNVEDFWQNGRLVWLRLHEKGGRHHEVPAHHNVVAYVDAYLQAAGIAGERKSPLFRSAVRKTGRLSVNRMNRRDVLQMIKRRARSAGLSALICCHTFRATGITTYLENGGKLENAQMIAGHESPRTTKLYDRTGDEITLDEIERIVI